MTKRNAVVAEKAKCDFSMSDAVRVFMEGTEKLAEVEELLCVLRSVYKELASTDGTRTGSGAEPSITVTVPDIDYHDTCKVTLGLDTVLSGFSPAAVGIVCARIANELHSRLSKAIVLLSGLRDAIELEAAFLKDNSQQAGTIVKMSEVSDA